jgi:hypothetical protein
MVIGYKLTNSPLQFTDWRAMVEASQENLRTVRKCKLPGPCGIQAVFY